MQDPGQRLSAVALALALLVGGATVDLCACFGGAHGAACGDAPEPGPRASSSPPGSLLAAPPLVRLAPGLEAQASGHGCCAARAAAAVPAAPAAHAPEPARTPAPASAPTHGSGDDAPGPAWRAGACACPSLALELPAGEPPASAVAHAAPASRLALGLAPPAASALDAALRPRDRGSGPRAPPGPLRRHLALHVLLL